VIRIYKVKYTRVKTIWGKPATIAYRKDTNDSGVIRSVMVYDEYLAQRFDYEDGDIFIDLGAHIGTWSVLMAMLNPTFTVYSIEPIPENYALLLKNVSVNGLKNVRSFLASASSDSQGKDSVYYTDDSTDFGKAHKFVGSMLGGAGKTIHVDKISLNDIFEKHNIEKCKVIKADCEGCETSTFSTLKEEHLKKIEYVIGEFHGWKIDYKTFCSYFEPYFEDLSGKMWPDEEGLRRFLFKRK